MRLWRDQGKRAPTGSHLGRGNEGVVIQEAAFGQGALIGAQGVYGEERQVQGETILRRPLFMVFQNA